MQKLDFYTKDKAFASFEKHKHRVRCFGEHTPCFVCTVNGRIIHSKAVKHFEGAATQHLAAIIGEKQLCNVITSLYASRQVSCVINIAESTALLLGQGESGLFQGTAVNLSDKGCCSVEQYRDKLISVKSFMTSYGSRWQSYGTKKGVIQCVSERIEGLEAIIALESELRENRLFQTRLCDIALLIRRFCNSKGADILADFCDDENAVLVPKGFEGCAVAVCSVLFNNPGVFAAKLFAFRCDENTICFGLSAEKSGAFCRSIYFEAAKRLVRALDGGSFEETDGVFRVSAQFAVVEKEKRIVSELQSSRLAYEDFARTPEAQRIYDALCTPVLQ